MPPDRKPFSIFEEAQPQNAGAETVSRPSSSFSVFDQGTVPAQSRSQGTQPQRNESNTLFGDAKAETVIGEFGAGLQGSVRQVASTAPALGSIALNVLAPETSKMLAEYALQVSEGGAQRGIENIEQAMVLDPMVWARYVAGTLGEAVPFIASIIGGAGGVGVLSKLMARRGVPLATRKFLESTAPQQLGAFGTAAAIETGATTQELYKSTGEVHPIPSIAAGAAKGALESVFPLILSKQLGLTVGQAEGLAGRLLQRAASPNTALGRAGVGLATEGVTEFSQEEIDLITREFLDENFQYLGPEANSRRLNALAAGAVGGGIFSQVPGFNSQTALEEQDIRTAALDAPVLFGAEYNELPSSGPEEMVRNAHEGLDGTAGMATGVLGDQLLGEVDLRKRGLYAAVVPGRDTTFGTQDQANNDAGYYGVDGFVRLDPNRVARKDVSASVEDLPSTVNDPRVEFLSTDTAKDASSALGEAINLKDRARKETRVVNRENLLSQAARKYRAAVNLGARVEPYIDGQVILRDETKLADLVDEQSKENIQPQITQATSFQTRTRSNGEKFAVFTTGSTKNRKRPGGLALDLENVNPDDVTGLPTRDLARSILASQAISRRLSVSAAKGQGIRFLEGTENQQELLGELVKVLTAMSATKRFAAQKEPIVERFMGLVDRGLRIDVAPATSEFAVLRPVRRSELQDPAREIVGQEFTQEAGVKKLVKSRARRTKEPSVSRKVSFAVDKLERLFSAQLHNTYLQKIVVGELAGGEGKGAYKQQSSPLVNLLRDIVKPMRLKTDFVVEIVQPGALGTQGVSYQNKDVYLTQGGKPQKRTVIYIDPWKFAAPTEGGKPLKGRKNETARLARRFGTPEYKHFTSDEQVAKFWGEFSYTLGKIIVDFEWSALPQGEKDLIMQAHRRETFIARSLSKQNAIARVVAHPLLESAMGSRGRKEQFYQFEEWIVQNVARVLADPETRLGPVQQFFHTIGQQIKGVLRRIRDTFDQQTGSTVFDPRKGESHEVVKEWIARLYERGRTSDEESFLSESTRNSLLESIQKNQSALAGMNLEYAVATPERASSFQVRKLLDILPKENVEDRQKLEGLLAWSDHINTTLEWGLGVQQLAEINPHIAPLREYVSTVRAMENEGVSWSTIADNRLREINKLGKDQQGRLWRFMAELDSMSYLSQEELRSGKSKPRWPTPDELVKIVRAHGLSKEAFDTYQKVRQDFLSFLSYLELVSVRNAEEYISDAVLRKERVDEIRGEISQMRARPYFPHMRFGEFAVTVKNNKNETLFFATYDTEKQRQEAVKKIAKTYNVPKDNRIVEDRMSPALQHYQGLPRFALKNVKEALGLNSEDLTDQQKNDARLLDEMAFDAAPLTSFRQNLRERQGTPGFSLDGARSYANYFARSSKFVARMAYANKLQDQITQVRKSGSPISKDTRTRIADYLQRHYESEMNPAGDLATLRSIAFSWYFAFVPSAAFVNLTQLPIVTYPYLGAKFGDFKGGGKLVKALEDNIKEYWQRYRTGEVPDTPKQEAIDQAHDDRLIDDGFATELAAIANGPTLARTLPGDKASRTVRHIAQWGAKPFAVAERTNRGVTFRAAYDLALENPEHPFVKEVVFKNKVEADRLRIDRGWSEQQIGAYLAGAQAVRDTQFEYARWSRPRVMQGWKGVVLMFKTYLQNMLFFMFKQDSGVQARFLLTLLAGAGIMGLPGAEDVEELAKFVGRKLGYNLSPKKELRKLMVQYTSQPDVLLHGASRVGFGIPAILHGLGLPSPTPDLSGSLSMGKLVPGLSAGLNPQSSRFNEMLGDVTQEVLGPAFGVPLSMYNAITDMSLPADDPKRWERALPRALRGASKASRYLAEQRERDRGGGTVYEFDPNDWNDQLDAINTGLGFNPTSVARQWDYLISQREALGYWQARRGMLMSQYWRAKRMKDKEGTSDAVEAMKKYNQEVPHSAMKITRKNLSQSVTTRARNLRLKEAQVPRQKYLRPLAKEVQGLYPEAQTPQDRREILRKPVR